MISQDQQEFADAFLDDSVTLRLQRQVATPSGGLVLETQSLESVRASVRPGDVTTAEEAGRVVQVQLGEVRLSAEISLRHRDKIEHEGIVWEVIGMDGNLSNKMLTFVSVKRLIP